MNRPWDMNHVRSTDDLRVTLTTEHWPASVFGDTIGGKSFTDAESDILIRAEKKNRPVLACGWREVWSNLTCWTIINCRPETAEEIEEYSEALNSDEETR